MSNGQDQAAGQPEPAPAPPAPAPEQDIIDVYTNAELIGTDNFHQTGEPADTDVTTDTGAAHPRATDDPA
ncbi:hypothetical protein ACWC10_25315 [Streptomyces sp. NPDC001595]|uniref:hypothetical protein n=1 Tax=Streptomyces sp. NPDC001532 TaxID=3154520 RepID=UPI003327447F